MSAPMDDLCPECRGRQCGKCYGGGCLCPSIIHGRNLERWARQRAEEIWKDMRRDG